MNRILVLRSMILAVSMAAANLTADGTWTVQPSGTAANLDEVQFVDPGTGWIWGRSGVLLATTDGGETWENQPGGDIGSFGGLDFIDGRTGRAFRTITTESDPDHYWICSVFKTTDGGMNWDFLCDNADYSFRDMQFAGPDTGFAIAEQFVHKFFVLRTTDCGVTWLPSFSQDFQETGPRLLYVIDSRHVWAAFKQSDGEG
ncbi:hypothetical protein JW906_11730, partial [bacterium]|nr:hypothetical protein [bacterium]